MEKKLGSNTHEVAALATTMQREFLERYFGKNRDVQRFARDALVNGRSDVAKEVNRAITVLGTPPDSYAAESFVNKVKKSLKYNSQSETTPIFWISVLFVVVIGVFGLFGLLAIITH